MSIEFEWDEHKSQVNHDKHGVSFEEARSIWIQDYLEVQGLVHPQGEEIRNATMGLIGGEVYVAIWTLRENRIRLISVRRARDYEKEAFNKKSLQDD